MQGFYSFFLTGLFFIGLIVLGRYLHKKELRELTDEEFNARLRGDL